MQRPLFRRKYIIYPRFQLGLLTLNGIAMSGLFTATLFAVNRSYAFLRAQGFEIGLVPEHSYFYFLDLQSKLVYRSISIAFAACLLISSVMTVVLSHRLAGPVYRLKQYFLKLPATMDGVAPLRFRKGDFFSDLPEIINQALARLKR